MELDAETQQKQWAESTEVLTLLAKKDTDGLVAKQSAKQGGGKDSGKDGNKDGGKNSK